MVESFGQVIRILNSRKGFQILCFLQALSQLCLLWPFFAWELVPSSNSFPIVILTLNCLASEVPTSPDSPTISLPLSPSY